MRPINPQLLCQVFCRHSLKNAAHDEDDGDTRVAAPTPNGTGEDVVHLAAYSTLGIKDWVSASVMGSLIRRQEMTAGTM